MDDTGIGKAMGSFSVTKVVIFWQKPLKVGVESLSQKNKSARYGGTYL